MMVLMRVRGGKIEYSIMMSCCVPVNACPHVYRIPLGVAQPTRGGVGQTQKLRSRAYEICIVSTSMSYARLQ